MGHVHLSVADLAETESFYADVLGFDVTVRSYPGALFLSAGGYHHHVGANTWTSAGVPRRAGALRLGAAPPSPSSTSPAPVRAHSAS
ncbi:MAG: VOC family protein [Thermoleophilaceae bacterium]